MKGLTQEQQIAALATTKLTEKEMAEALVKSGMTKREAVATAALAAEAREKEHTAAASFEAAGAEGTQTAATGALTGAEVTATGATTGLTAAFKGLWATVKANPYLIIIAAVVAAGAAINAFNEKNKEAIQNIKELSDKKSEIASTERSESKQLSNLIKQYKELAKNGRIELSDRDKAKEIQDEISNIIGDQVGNLDLVNGRYQTQLKILQDIKDIEDGRVSGANSDAVKAARANADTPAYDDSSTTVGGTWGVSDLAQYMLRADKNNNMQGREFSFSGNGDTLDELKKLESLIVDIFGHENINAKLIDVAGAHTIAFYFSEKLDVEQYRKYWQEAISLAEQAGAEKTKQAMQRTYDSLFGENGTYTLLKSESGQMASQKAQEYINAEIPTAQINDFNDFISLQQKIVENLWDNDEIQEAIKNGEIEFSDLYKIVGAKLSEVNDYAKYYSEYLSKQEIINSRDDWTYTKYDDEGNPTLGFQENATNSYALGDYYEGIRGEDRLGNDFEDWINSLSGKDIELVVKIQEDFTSEKVEQYLQTASEGGSVDLKLRPLIDTSELGNVGWVDENGNPLSGGKATTYTSTYSNESGTRAINFTPIIVDENGKFVGVLSPEELEEYAQKVINGTIDDSDTEHGGLKLQIGAEFTGENAIQEAENAAKKEHIYQNIYYNGGGIENSPTSVWKDTFEEYEGIVEEAVNTTEDGAVRISTALQEIFNVKGDDNKALSERLNSAKTNIDKLIEAQSALETGDFGSDGYTKWLEKLINEFPQLAGHTDDLQQAISLLMGEMKNNAISEFNTQVDKLRDSKMMTSADEAAISQQIELMNNWGKSAIQFKNNLSDVVSAFKTVKSAIDDYNESGYLSLENLNSLLSIDGRYLRALMNERGEIDLSTESYKKLVKAEAIQLKAEMLQKALDSVNDISTKAQALQYLDGCQSSAAQSALDLADAKWKEAYANAMAKDIEQGTGDLYRRTVIEAKKVYETQASLIDKYVENAFTIGELTEETDAYTKSLKNEQTALENAKKALENQKKALEKQKTGYTDALNAIKDLVSWVEKYITQIKKDEKEALEQRKKDHDEIIEKRKEEIELARKEAETAEELADLQKQYAKDVLSYDIASMDDSAAGKKAQKEASDKMLESDKNLRQKLSDNAYDMRIEELENDKELFDKNIDEQIEVIDKFLSDEVALHKAACKMIDEDRGELYGKLKQYCLQYTTTTEAEFNHMWQSAQAAIQKYNGDNITTYNLMNDLQGKIYDVDKAIDTVAESISAYETKIDGVKSKLNDLKDAAINVKNALNNSVPKYEPKPEYYYKYGGKTYYSYKTNREEAVADIVQQTSGKLPPFKQGSIKYEIQKYAKGTRYTKSNPFISQEDGFEAIFGKLQNGNYTLAAEGSQVFNSRMTDNLYNFANRPSAYLASKLGDITNVVRNITSNSKSYGDISVQTSPIYIQGNATPETAKEFAKYMKSFEESLINKIMHYAQLNRKPY